MYNRWRYALYGGLLGMGSPLGAMAWRVFGSDHAWLMRQMLAEWKDASYFYGYMAFGTVTAFSLFGYWIGKRSDTLNDRSDVVQNTFENLNVLAITDGLTGVYNHRYIHERLGLEMESALRYQSPLTCFMLDIDNFKRVNDTFGHPYGDLVLMTVARLIRENVRRVDLVGRYGGEEFFVLMPHTTLEVAHPIAERIRLAVQNHPFAPQGSRIEVTLSIGMSLYPTAGIKTGDKNGLLAAVDTALYDAKRLGKNQTMVWQTKNSERAIHVVNTRASE